MRLLSTCLGQRPMPTADGQMCTSFSACNPGSVCFGPVRLPLTRWTEQPSDIKCRKVCGDPEDSDAGADDDAGVSTCPSGTRCVPFSESGLSLAGIPKPPFGQCE
jgi:hypothetical protein